MNNLEEWMINSYSKERFLASCKGGKLGDPKFCVYWGHESSGKRCDRFRINGKSRSIKKIAYVIVNKKLPPSKIDRCSTNINCINPPHQKLYEPISFEKKQKVKKRNKKLTKEQIFKILKGEKCDIDISKYTLSRIKNKKSYQELINEYKEKG